MDVLTCKTPEMVRKEIWAKLLAYNLIRGLIAQTAHDLGATPRDFSFKPALAYMNEIAVRLESATALTAAELRDWLSDRHRQSPSERPSRPHRTATPETSREELSVIERSPLGRPKPYTECYLGIEEVPFAKVTFLDTTSGSAKEPQHGKSEEKRA